MHYQLAGSWFIINVHEPRQRKGTKLQLVFWIFFDIVGWLVGLLFQTIRLIKFREKSTADNSRLSEDFFFLHLFVYSIMWLTFSVHLHQKPSNSRHPLKIDMKS